MIRGIDTKLKILEAVCSSDMPLSIYSLSKKLNLSPGVISHHIEELKSFGIVSVRKVLKGNCSKKEILLKTVFACKEGVCFQILPHGILVFICPFKETCSRREYIYTSEERPSYCKLMDTKLGELGEIAEYIRKLMMPESSNF